MWILGRDGLAREVGDLREQLDNAKASGLEYREALAVARMDVARLQVENAQQTQRLGEAQGGWRAADDRANAAEKRYHELADKALEMKREGFATSAPPPESVIDESAGVPQEFLDAVIEVYGSERHPMAKRDLAWAELELRKRKNNPEDVPRIAKLIQEGAEHEG